MSQKEYVYGKMLKYLYLICELYIYNSFLSHALVISIIDHLFIAPLQTRFIAKSICLPYKWPLIPNTVIIISFVCGIIVLSLGYHLE